MKTSCPDVLTSSGSSRPPEASGGLAPSAARPLSEKTHFVGLFSDSGDAIDEEWRDIPGYEGQYQASSLGRVRSLDRTITYRKGNVEHQIFYPGKVLKPCSTRTRPYLKVTLSQRRDLEVHALVAAAFHGPCPEGCEVLHINGCLTDNRPENLRYDTHSENLHDIYIQGGKARKLTAEDVHQIRFGLNCGIIQKELAHMYHVSRYTIGDIQHGRTFQWLTPAKVEI